LLEITAQCETIEDLQELSLKPPYNIDCSWSNEASALREIAVQTPTKLSHDFILNYFKSLRIVDKKVSSDHCMKDSKVLIYDAIVQ